MTQLGEVTFGPSSSTAEGEVLDRMVWNTESSRATLFPLSTQLDVTVSCVAAPKEIATRMNPSAAILAPHSLPGRIPAAPAQKINELRGPTRKGTKCQGSTLTPVSTC